ncbi:hypothetical protein BgiBS90_016389 [Biomphalaria glabrata]|nr:hypothetical protein BgiBS90_016389 [Biomphalaria glabrata]
MTTEASCRHVLQFTSVCPIAFQCGEVERREGEDHVTFYIGERTFEELIARNERKVCYCLVFTLMTFRGARDKHFHDNRSDDLPISRQHVATTCHLVMDATSSLQMICQSADTTLPLLVTLSWTSLA